MLKALLNGRFLPIPLDRKKKKDKRSLGRAKIGETSSENALLIIPLYWLSFRLPKTGVSVYGENHVEKSKRDDLEEADNPGTGIDTPDIDDMDGRPNNSSIGIDIPDTKYIYGGVENPGTGTNTSDTDNTDERADNPGIGTNISNVDEDGWVDDPGTSADIADGNKRA